MPRRAWVLLLLEVIVFAVAYHFWNKQQWVATDLKPECYGEVISVP